MQTSNAKHRILMRVGAVVAATLSALIAWTAISPLGGTELSLPVGSDVRTIGASDVAFAALASGLAAIGVATLVGHRADRPRRTWAILATGVFVVTLLGPITSGAAAPVAWSLIALHSVVAVVLIPQLYRTLPGGGTVRTA